MRVLGLETSCDETAVAVYDTAHGLMGDTLYSQIALHQAYGGVVPELAARDHASRCAPMIASLLKEKNIDINSLDGVAYTCGPGLVGALLVGASVGHALAEALQIPALGVNHLEGHVMAVHLEEERPAFPFLSLLVSGGHTMLLRVDGWGHYTTIGQTLDDSVGEAFDKTAKLLGMGYPGGPALAAAADAYAGKPWTVPLPRPMVNRPGLDFSFSGLKTHVATAVAQLKQDSGDLTEVQCGRIAQAFQAAVVDTLVIKCERALKQTGLSRLVIGGGVGANAALRRALKALAASRALAVYYPRPRYCTDNAAMIAYVGHARLKAGECSQVMDVRPRFPLDAVA